MIVDVAFGHEQLRRAISQFGWMHVIQLPSLCRVRQPALIPAEMSSRPLPRIFLKLEI